MVNPLATETSYSPAAPQATTGNIKKGDSFKARFAQGPFGPFIPAAIEEQEKVPQKAVRDPFIRHLTTEYFGAEYHSSLAHIHDKAVAEAFSPPRKSFLRRVVTAPFAASTWRMKMLPPLSPEIFIRGVKTLPSRKEEKAEPATSNSQDMVPASLADKVQLLENVSDKLDALFRENILNTRKLSVEDRKKDLDLIKDYQQKIRATYTAPESIVKKQAASAPPLMLKESASPTQNSVVQTATEETSSSHSRRTTVYEIVDGEEEDFECIDTLYTPGANPYATTVQEILDEETVESLDMTYAFFNASEGGEVSYLNASEDPSEQTFSEAWAVFKATAKSITEHNRPEDGIVQKICLTLLSSLNRVVSSLCIPGLSLVTDMTKYVFELHALSKIREWENRNAIRKALIEISKPIITSSEGEALDMNAVSNINSFTTETAINLANATGAAMQVHTEDVASKIAQHTEKLQKDLDAGTVKLQKDLNAGTARLQKDFNNGAAILIDGNAAIIGKLEAIEANQRRQEEHQRKLAQDVAPLLRVRKTSTNSLGSNADSAIGLNDGSPSGSRSVSPVITDSHSPDFIHKAEVQEIVDKALKAQEEKHAKEIAGLEAKVDRTNQLLEQFLLGLQAKNQAAAQGN